MATILDCGCYIDNNGKRHVCPTCADTTRILPKKVKPVTKSDLYGFDLCADSLIGYKEFDNETMYIVVTRTDNHDHNCKGCNRHWQVLAMKLETDKEDDDIHATFVEDISKPLAEMIANKILECSNYEQAIKKYPPKEQTK